MQEEFKMNRADALKIFNEVSDAGKQFMKDRFGEENFTKSRIEDRIHSVEDACKEIGRDINEARPFPNAAPGTFQDWINACGEAATLIEAFEEGGTKDWNNYNQRKHINIYNMEDSAGSGFGLSLYDVDFARSVTGVASRLHSLKPEHQRLLWERFPDVYKRLMKG